ncbi:MULTISPECIES: hypothetical protein [unclassified Bradyrhizobium]|uniref:hypothetical protein n=1 Tax=unclassified Bradyrhizobium TaxID=2631580 RepID=UPI0028EEFDE8|nr:MULTISPECIES: hypothetical protein [unclassified Bradyrhizobium]
MSLAVCAVRICAYMALKNATSVGDRVFDSVVDPRALLGKDASPTIVVLAEQGKKIIMGRDLLAAEHSVDLAFEMFVAKATTITIPAAHTDSGEDEPADIIEYAATDAAYENRLRRIAYEIDAVLTGDPGPWAEMFRRLVVRFLPDAGWGRGADSDGGRKFNFIREIYSVEPVADPVRGAPLSELWSDLLDLMATVPDLKPLSLDWRSLITTLTLPAWRLAAATLGLTYRELRSMGLAPALDHQATDVAEPAVLASVTLDPEDFAIYQDAAGGSAT